MISPYQRIEKDGELIQPGNMDTPVKFDQLTQGIDLKGKRVLDAGCNLGAMCNLATEEGATTFGVDIHRGSVDRARSIFPKLEFECLEAESIYGNYDIIIASAMLHYVKDLDTLFKVFARCGRQVLCDVWLHDSQVPIFALSHRGIYIPSESAFRNVVGKYFRTIEKKGLALTPDQSKRYIFHISGPKPDPPKAIVIYGVGNTGKTTLAKTYFGYVHLMTDRLFVRWKVTAIEDMFSVSYFSGLVKGHKEKAYNDFFIKILSEQLDFCINRDIVIEGYDLLSNGFRRRVVNLLSDWKVKEIHLEKIYKQRDKIVLEI